MTRLEQKIEDGFRAAHARIAAMQAALAVLAMAGANAISASAAIAQCAEAARQDGAPEDYVRALREIAATIRLATGGPGG